MTLEPLIPYLNPPPLELWGPAVSIKPFGTLVAPGVYLGTEIVRRKGEQYKLDSKALSSFIFYILMGGFIGGQQEDSILSRRRSRHAEYADEHDQKRSGSLLNSSHGSTPFCTNPAVRQSLTRLQTLPSWRRR